MLTFGCNDEGALGRVTEGSEGAESIPGEVELPGKVIQISAGDSHTAALLEDGRVFAWGTFRVGILSTLLPNLFTWIILHVQEH